MRLYQLGTSLILYHQIAGQMTYTQFPTPGLQGQGETVKKKKQTNMFRAHMGHNLNNMRERSQPWVKYNWTCHVMWQDLVTGSCSSHIMLNIITSNIFYPATELSLWDLVDTWSNFRLSAAISLGFEKLMSSPGEMAYMNSTWCSCAEAMRFWSSPFWQKWILF